MVLADEAAAEPASEPTASPPEPRYGHMPKGMYSPWDAIAARQEALKQAAWQAFHEDQDKQQEELYTQFLESDDPGFCADYLQVPIDPEVAAYTFPEEDPPPLPAPKRPRRSCRRNSSTRRQQKNKWRDIPLTEPLTRDEKRYLAWTYYHLKLQDLQLQEKILAKQAKIDRLRHQLGGATDVAASDVPLAISDLAANDLPPVRPHVEVVEFDLLAWMDHVRADQRGPPQSHPRLRASIYVPPNR